MYIYYSSCSVISQPLPLELACLCFRQFIVEAYVPRVLVGRDTVFDELLQAGNRLRRCEPALIQDDAGAYQLAPDSVVHTDNGAFANHRMPN